MIGASGTGALVFRGGNNTTRFLTNDSNSLATIAAGTNIGTSNNANQTVSFGGSGNWQVDTDLRFSSPTLTTRNLSVAKTGDGTLTLTTTNSNTGATSVTAGKLIVNGSISTSTTTVSGTGTLGGIGTVAAVIVQAGGTLAPGDAGIESLNATSVSLADNANFDIEINKTLATNDSVMLTGNFSNVLAITTGANLNLALTGTFVLGDRFTLADYNTISGTWNGGLFNLGAGTANLADDSVFQYGSYDWRINYDDLTNTATNSTESYVDGGKYLTLTVVPEPNVAALLGGLGMLALLRRRR